MAEQLDAEPLRRAGASRPLSPAPASCCAPPTSSATRSTRSCWPATASSAPAPRRAARVRPRDRHLGRRDLHGQGRCSTTPTRARSAPSASSRATTRWRASRTPTSCIAVGYDLVEHAPEHWNPKRDKRIIVIDTVAGGDRRLLHARGRAHRRPLPRAQPPGRGVPRRAAPRRLRAAARGRPRQARARRKDDDAFPMRPPRALWELRRALGRDDMLISDVGLHKLWIGRMFPAHEPNTVLIANGLAGMGFALPCRDRGEDRAARSPRRDRQRRRRLPHELQELETAVRLRHADRERHLGEQPVRLDRVEAGQEVRPPLRHRLHQPRLRQARRGVRACRVACESVEDFGRHLSPRPVARPCRR